MRQLYIRQDENAFEKKMINKQPSVPSAILILTLPGDWIGIQLIWVSCIQRSPFRLFTLIFRTSLLNASVWRTFSVNVIIDHLIINEFVRTAPKRSSSRAFRSAKVNGLYFRWFMVEHFPQPPLSARTVVVVFFFPLQNTVKVPSSFL